MAERRRQGCLTKDMSDKLEAAFPGVEFNFSQYIEDNVEEAVSGVKGENSVKLFGNDLQTLTSTAAKIKAVMAGVPGIADLAVFTSLGQPTVQIEVDRDHAPPATGSRPAISTRRCRPRWAARPRATSMNTAATATSTSWCGWRPTTARASRPSATSRSGRRTPTAAASSRFR